MFTAPLITETDRTTLSRLLSLRRATHQDVGSLVRLSERLKEARSIHPEAIPPTVVTLHSRVCIRTLGTGEKRTLTLVPPGRASAGDLSVLTPVGMAVFGRTVGDLLEVEVPAGHVRLAIESVAQSRPAPRRTEPTPVGMVTVSMLFLLASLLT